MTLSATERARREEAIGVCRRWPASQTGGRDRRRSGDLPLFRRTLCRLSYPTVATAPGRHHAVPTGFEPATSGLTGRRALQTAPRDLTPCVGELGRVEAGPGTRKLL